MVRFRGIGLSAASLAALLVACEGGLDLGGGGSPDAPLDGSTEPWSGAEGEEGGFLRMQAPLVTPTWLPTGFQETIVFSGLTQPTTVAFSPDGRVFVAEKSGIIKVFASLTATTPTVFADLSTRVYNFWDRGLLGLALHPNFPATPYVYVLYALDAEIGGTPPRWGTAGVLSDPCPTPPGPTGGGCVAAARLSRLTASGSVMSGSELVMLENWCQQYPSHSIGTVRFGRDGALYVGGGDGASFTFADYGQVDNVCHDTVGLPNGMGGALRALNMNTAGYSRVTYDGKILRLDPLTGAALPTNPLAGSPVAGQDRIVAQGLRNPFRFTHRPGTDELWIGDVGWTLWEEIERIVQPTASVANFGWPCYEGAAVQGAYRDLGTTACANLYGSPGAAQGPYYTYHHDASVVADDGCPVGSSAVSGLAFYTGTAYPPAYDGTLFFSDYSRGCIWRMSRGANGLPDPASRSLFVRGASGPIELAMGPGDSLYYVDFTGGTLRRIESFLEDQVPTAVLASDVSSGLVPLTVHFDGSGSTDPDPGDTLSFAWDLDGDGQFDDSAAVAPQWTYTAAGVYTVRLRVTDSRGATSTASKNITAGASAPAATIALPAAGTTFKVGDVISFQGSATDPQDGTLPASRLSWSLVQMHCPSTCHEHPIQTFAGVASGSFTAPDHDYPSHLELRLTATDSSGLTDTKTLVLQPRTVTLTFAANPSGMSLSVGATAEATPFVRTVIAGSANSVSAAASQSFDGKTWYFQNWSDGGAASHLLTAPESTATYTATYGLTPAGQLPAPWVLQDIGTTTPAGSAQASGGTLTVRGSGADIWGSADAFAYLYQPMTGDGQIVARLASVQNTNSWAKAGVMIRESLTAASRHAFMALTPGNGAAFQRRTVGGGSSEHTGLAGVTAPRWVRVVRSGSTLTGAVSTDGSAWTPVGTTTIPMGQAVYVGLAVTSHAPGTSCTAVFDGVSLNGGGGPPGNQPPTVSLTAPAAGANYSAPATVGLSANAFDPEGALARVDFLSGTTVLASDTTSPYSFAWSGVPAGSYVLTARAVDVPGAATDSAPVTITVSDPASPLPAPWVFQDVGATSPAGSVQVAGSTFTVRGSGADIWGTADGFAYVYQALSGDGQVVARLASIQNTNAWAKAGVMIRESTAAGSRHAFMAVTPGNGAAFQRRPETGGTSLNTGLPGVTAPRWVRLARSGSTFTGSVSADGATWTVVGTATVAMGPSVLVGLAVTSHSAGTSCAAAFDGISVNGGGGPPANQPPTVTLTAPAANAAFTAPATVGFAANAFDPEGALARVEFLSGTTVVATDTTAPYAFSWTGVPAGTYTLTARAVDVPGAATASAPVTITVSDPSSPLPAPWTGLDVGAVGLPGSASVASGVFTVQGSGADIWSNVDSFFFVRRSWSGNGEVVARVATQQNTNGWAKSGVMIRDGAAANAMHAMMVVTPSNGAVFQYRNATGNWTTNVPGPVLAAPAWVRLVRSGNTISGYVSTNGTTWTLVGSASIPLPAGADWGLAVSSHNNAVLGRSTFDGVAVQ